MLLILPAYNEGACIKSVAGNIKRFRGCGDMIDYIVVNDGSTDGTLRVCRENGIPVIDLVHNLGIGGAVQTGYIYAEAAGYDIAVQFDGDGQHDINSLPDLIRPILGGECDFVVGSRFLEGTSRFKSTAARRVGIKTLSAVIRVFTGLKITDPTSGYRAAGKRAIAFLADNYPADYPEPESLVDLKKNNFRIKETQVNMLERGSGVSSIGALKSAYYMVKVTLAVICTSIKRRQRDK